MRLLLAPLALVVLAVSPALADPSKSAATTEVRSTGSFTGLAIPMTLEVDLAIGSSTKVELRGPAVWLARIDTKVTDGTLVISMPGKWQNVPKLKAVITTPSLDAVTISGTVDLEATGLTGKTLALDVSGTGDIALAGAVDRVDMDLSGTAEVDAKGLKTTNADVSISGTSNVEVTTSKQLDVSISGVGSVHAYGKPKVTKHISGTGSVSVD